RLRLRHIVCFLEVVRLGSIVKASSSLNISQPAVTKTIQDLEELLGVVLFDRSHRWFTLTEPGEVFLHYASDSVTTLRRGIDVIRNVDAHAITLRVGVLPTASSRILPQAV